MKKLIDLPEETVRRLKKLAKKRRMSVKALIEIIVIENIEDIDAAKERTRKA